MGKFSALKTMVHIGLYEFGRGYPLGPKTGNKKSQKKLAGKQSDKLFLIDYCQEQNKKPLYDIGEGRGGPICIDHYLTSQ